MKINDITNPKSAPTMAAFVAVIPAFLKNSAITLVITKSIRF